MMLLYWRCVNTEFTEALSNSDSISHYFQIFYKLNNQSINPENNQQINP